MTVISWPRGRYNGQKIEGFALTFKLHVLYWQWLPVCAWSFGNPYVIWLCFTLRAHPEYGTRSTQGKVDEAGS